MIQLKKMMNLVKNRHVCQNKYFDNNKSYFRANISAEIVHTCICIQCDVRGSSDNYNFT